MPYDVDEDDDNDNDNNEYNNDDKDDYSSNSVNLQARTSIGRVIEENALSIDPWSS